MTASRFFVVFLVAGVVSVIGLRIYLPHWVTGYVNRQISGLKGYSGYVGEIDISLWRGAYEIYNLNIFKEDNGTDEPFAAARIIDLSLQWKALLRGRIVGEANVRDISINFARNQTGAGGGWGQFVDALSPFDINHLSVDGGRVSYLDYGASPDVNIYIRDIQGFVTNLRNVEDRQSGLPSEMKVTGVSIGEGNFNLQGSVNVLKKTPDFDLDFRLENAALPALNDYTRAAAAVDFKKGSASLYSELAAADGDLTGYLKLIVSDMTTVDLQSQDQNIFNAAWETFVAAFMTLFKNQTKDQFALRIPIEGSLANPQQDVWEAFLSIFRNAFVEAFPKDVEGNISFSDALSEGSQ